jgi:hypothetical protein
MSNIGLQLMHLDPARPNFDKKPRENLAVLYGYDPHGF